MPRLYAVQHCHKMRGWEDLVYFHQWATAVRASELAARDQPGLVTRVTRKPHGFVPPLPRPPPTPVFSIGQDLPVEYVPAFPVEYTTIDLELDEAMRLQRKHQKKLSREAGAKARIPTWYDRINQSED
jgi:hypothetical protein